MMLTRRAAALSLASVALGAVAAAPGEAAAAPRLDSRRLLDWKGAEQVHGFSHVSDLFAVRPVRAGGRVHPLRVGGRLPARFRVDGIDYDLDDYMMRSDGVGLLILKGDDIRLEQYRLGFGPDDLWATFSVEKSFVATLLGAAIKQGAVASVQDDVARYLPILGGTALDGVTIEQVLHMSSGLAWDETARDSRDRPFFVDVWANQRRGALLPYIASHPRAWPPGSRWDYNSGNAQIIVELIVAATGKPLSDYLSETVWRPFGMERDANWMLDGKDGMEAGSISACLRDYGRFCRFILANGVADGVARLPGSWIAQATRATAPGMRYGYMWWPAAQGFNATGAFGQLFHIRPDKDLAVVVLGARSGRPDAPSDGETARLMDAIAAVV